jgi:hypothetical protein
MSPVEATKFMEVLMSRSAVSVGVIAAIIASAITLVLVCVPMSAVWFGTAS